MSREIAPGGLPEPRSVTGVRTAGSSLSCPHGSYQKFFIRVKRVQLKRILDRRAQGWLGSVGMKLRATCARAQLAPLLNQVRASRIGRESSPSR